MSTPGRTTDSMEEWIGLAHVRPRQGNSTLGNALGAHVAAVALAISAKDFSEKVVALLNEYEFDVIAIEDVELARDRAKRVATAIEIDNLTAQLSSTSPVILGTFHSYLSN